MQDISSVVFETSVRPEPSFWEERFWRCEIIGRVEGCVEMGCDDCLGVHNGHYQLRCRLGLHVQSPLGGCYGLRTCS